MNIKKISTTIIFFVLLCSCVRAGFANYSGFVFGTYYNIAVDDKNDYTKEIEEVFNNVNNKMSVFNKQSELNKINNNKQAEVSEELINILKTSEAIYIESDGYFDVSLGQLIELWGFGVNKENKVPSNKEIVEMLKYSGFNKVKIDGNNVIKQDPRLKINLSAIAKGYAVDKVCEMLDEKGVKNYLVDIGGEVKAKGKRKDRAFKIGLANPLEPTANKMVFELNNTAVATSGDYQNYFSKNGKKYSHTIDAKTGRPVFSELVSVSVFNDSCMLADAYATAIMAMGYDKGYDFAKTNNLKAILIKNDGSVKQVNIN